LNSAGKAQLPQMLDPGHFVSGHAVIFGDFRFYDDLGLNSLEMMKYGV
jgi:hypothetical protein